MFRKVQVTKRAWNQETRRYESVPPYTAWYHGHATEGDGNEVYAVAVLETTEGQMKTIPVEHVSFITPIPSVSS